MFSRHGQCANYIIFGTDGTPYNFTLHLKKEYTTLTVLCQVYSVFQQPVLQASQKYTVYLAQDCFNRPTVYFGTACDKDCGSFTVQRWRFVLMLWTWHVRWESRSCSRKRVSVCWLRSSGGMCLPRCLHDWLCPVWSCWLSDAVAVRWAQGMLKEADKETQRPAVQLPKANAEVFLF